MAFDPGIDSREPLALNRPLRATSAACRPKRQTGPFTDRMVRCALISSGLGYTARGIEIWMADLAAHLSGDLHVELWSGGPPPALPATVRVRRIRSLNRDSRLIRRAGWSRRYMWEQWSMLPGTLRALRRFSMNIAYLGDPVLAWHLKRFRRWHGARVVFMNGMRLAPGWARGFDGVHLLADPYLEEARAQLAGCDLDNFFAVPHFTDIERFQPASPDEKAAERERLGIPQDAMVVLSIGPVGTASGKRLDHLARELAAAGPGIMLLHAGSHEDGAAETRSAVNRALGPRVRWSGKVDREGICRLLRAADLYSLGSLREPFSIAVLEALASGLPVVHHDDPIMRWQTGDGGVVVSMDTPGAAAPAFQRLANDRAERARIGVAARQLATSRYAPGAVCERIASAFSRIVQRPGFWPEGG